MLWCLTVPNAQQAKILEIFCIRLLVGDAYNDLVVR